jgi:hypothetical protein
MQKVQLQVLEAWFLGVRISYSVLHSSSPIGRGKVLKQLKVWIRIPLGVQIESNVNEDSQRFAKPIECNSFWFDSNSLCKRSNTQYWKRA